MEKFRCSKYNKDVRYSRCIDCSEYNTCMDREIESGQRMVAIISLSFFTLILIIIVMSFLEVIL